MEKLKSLLEQYRNGERGLPSYLELQEIAEEAEKSETAPRMETQEEHL